MDKNIKAISRAKNKLRKIIEENFNMGCNLFTLYFKENIENISYANNEFGKYIKRARYKIGNFKYLATMQFKKSGAIKYLMVTDLNLSSIKYMSKIWNIGGIWVDEINHKGSLDSIILRMEKNIDDDRLIGKKAYFTSRNLIRH